jgi:hypothetical protein
MVKRTVQVCAALASALIFAAVVEIVLSEAGLLKLSSAASVWCFSAWLGAWLAHEILSHFRVVSSRAQLLTHLRYGPVAVLILFLALLSPLERIMVEYSRWEINRYIYSDASPERPPSFDLYYDQRAGGLRYPSPNHQLYGETAAAGMQSDDPNVRARAFQASVRVFAWDNLHDGPFAEVLRKARIDPDPMVRRLAKDFCASATPCNPLD